MAKIIEIEKGKYMLKIGAKEVALTSENAMGASNLLVVTEKTRLTEPEVRKLLKSKYRYIAVLGRAPHVKIPPNVRPIILRKGKKTKPTEKAKGAMQKGTPTYRGEHGHIIKRTRTGETGGSFKKKRRRRR